MELLRNPLSELYVADKLQPNTKYRHQDKCLSYFYNEKSNIYTELQNEMEFCLFSSHKLLLSFSGSRHVSHHLLVIHGLEDVVLPGAVVVAGAGLDEHHVLLHDLSVRAFELHGQGGGPVGGAAAAIQANSAKLRPVGLGGGAARDLKLHRLGESWSTDALFPFPDALLQLGLAGSHHAQSGLFLQSTFTVIVGDPGGNPQATGL